MYEIEGYENKKEEIYKYSIPMIFHDVHGRTELGISKAIEEKLKHFHEQECELNNHTHLTTVMADHDHEDGSGSEDNEDFMFDIDLSVVEGEVQDDDSCWSYETDNNDGAVAENSNIL